MAYEREAFNHFGPSHLTSLDWTKTHHRRSIAASLVQGVYMLEEDRKAPEALAPPWWEFFHFKLLRQLVDIVDFSIFGAIYEFKPPTSHRHQSIDKSPRYVIAFRGTLITPFVSPCSMVRDFWLNLRIILDGLHESSRFKIANKAIQDMVAAVGASNIWLAGHSLGSAIALLAGKAMAKTGIFVQAYLFNSPFISYPIERVLKDHKHVKHGIRIATSVVTAGLAMASKNNHQSRESVDPFIALSAWIPCLFVNLEDDLSSEYIGYFEHRKTMNEHGIGEIEKLATRKSLFGLLMGKESSEPFHLVPSANLTVNLRSFKEAHVIHQWGRFKKAHGIHQWWQPDLAVQTKLYKYSD